MTAWSRAQAAKRRRRRVGSTLAGVALVAMWPCLSAHAVTAWERHVLAEAAGDTAQTIAIKVGREVARTGSVETLTVAESAHGCVVAPVDVPADCATNVSLMTAHDGFVVRVERRDEVFTWDSRSARH